VVRTRTSDSAGHIAISKTRVMILIRFAIGMFALTLLGLAISLSGAQSAQTNLAEPAILRQR